jgi:hypothetical protein
MSIANFSEKTVGAIVTSALLLSAVFSTGLSLSNAFAQDATKAEEKSAEKEGEKAAPEEVIKTGTIASTGNYGFGPQAIGSGAGAPGDEPNVISASVSRASKDDCSVTFKNTSKDNGYSASFRVLEFDASGRKVNSKYMSASLGKGESKTQTVPCRTGNSVQVELVRASKK